MDVSHLNESKSFDFDVQTPLREYLDYLNLKVSETQQLSKIQLDTLCQDLGHNGINFVGDLQTIDTSVLELLGFPSYFTPAIDLITLSDENIQQHQQNNSPQSIKQNQVQSDPLSCPPNQMLVPAEACDKKNSTKHMHR